MLFTRTTNHFSTMKLATLLMLLLFNKNDAANQMDGMYYVLRSIEFEASVQSGPSSLVLLDATPQYPFNNILSAILRAPRLSHVVKYVVNGSWHKNLEKLPWNPSMLAIHPGNDVVHLTRTSDAIKAVLELFNPTTKVLVFIDYSNMAVVKAISNLIFKVKFASMVFFEVRSTRVVLWNPLRYTRWTKAPAPMFLFTWLRRSMSGRPITFYGDEPLVEFHWNVFWMQEVARYLGTEASEYRHYCDLYQGDDWHHCLARQDHILRNIDIRLQFVKMLPNPRRDFGTVVTGAPLNIKVGIPRDRPLNVAELMVMPFSWNVWLLLVAILLLAEVMKQLFPNLFQNDPTMLVLCGFERHNLHQAGQVEKISYLSMIILIFFASNAFETKMLSMMVSKPAIQRIKTLADLLQSDLKFYEDLEGKPHLVNQSLFGKMMIQGVPDPFDTDPGIGMIIEQDAAGILELTAFDYERMQPWYVLLDLEYHIGYEMYDVSERNPNAEFFRYVHTILFEAGLMDHQKRRAMDTWRCMLSGRRVRVHIDSKVDLNFGDMKPAWVVLGIGLGGGLFAFLGELVKKRAKGRVNPKVSGLNFRKRRELVELFDYE